MQAVKTKNQCIVGLTGGIATGKSTFSFIFKQLGARVVCCDELAHRALRKNTGTYKEIVRVFGCTILNDAKQIDRRKLATIVFKNKAERTKLEKIIHPFVFDKLFDAIKKTEGIIILDVPLLFETHFEQNVDQTIVVWCTKKEQVRRLCRRDGLTQTAADARIRTQMPLSTKKRKADHLIDNTDLETAVKMAKVVWKKIQSISKKK